MSDEGLGLTDPGSLADVDEEGNEKTMGQIFEECEPDYLAIGMTRDEYWNGPCYLTRLYREVHNMQIEAKNQELWLQGLYIYEGVSIAIGNAFRKKGTSPTKYREKPIRITPLTEEEKRQEVLEARRKIIAKVSALEKAWRVKEKREKDNARSDN